MAHAPACLNPLSNHPWVVALQAASAGTIPVQHCVQSFVQLQFDGVAPVCSRPPLRSMSAAHSAAPAAARMLSVQPTTCAPWGVSVCQSFKSVLTVMLMASVVHTTVSCRMLELLPPEHPSTGCADCSILNAASSWFLRIVLTRCTHHQHQPWHAQLPPACQHPEHSHAVPHVDL